MHAHTHCMLSTVPLFCNLEPNAASTLMKPLVAPGFALWTSGLVNLAAWRSLDCAVRKRELQGNGTPMTRGLTSRAGVYSSPECGKHSECRAAAHRGQPAPLEIASTSAGCSRGTCQAQNRT